MNELAAVAAALRAALPALPARDHAFAASILAAVEGGRPSPKQVEWADKLVARAKAPAPVPVAKVPVEGIISLMSGAKAKYPKVRLSAEGGQTVQLSIAGERSKYTGAVMVTDGLRFGENTYFGRIDPNGDLIPSHNMTEAVLALLVAFAANPAGIAATQGKLRGACCFCTRALDTKESLAVGYGPTCAKTYGLPWG